MNKRTARFIVQNIGQSASKWLKKFQSVVNHSIEILVPQAHSCVMCGRMILAASNGTTSVSETVNMSLPDQFRQSLCESCLSSVPWLLRIQCTLCGRGVECEDCVRRTKHYFVYNRSAVSYNETMRGWLARYKYRGDERLSTYIAQMLQPVFEQLTAEVRMEEMRSEEMLTESALHLKITHKRNSSRKRIEPQSVWDAITYVPISDERALDRGFNQAEQLASYLARSYRLPLYDLLFRSRHTEKMSFKSRRERLRDADTLFTLNEHILQQLIMNKSNAAQAPSPNNGKLRILLVDDIYTTGSTVNACSRTLSEQSLLPVEIYALTWARS